MSMVPMMGHVIRPNPKLAEEAPQYYMSMGHTAEEVAKRMALAVKIKMHLQYESHELAAKAIAEGKFKDEIVPVEVVQHYVMKTINLKEKRFNFRYG